ncbi:MAG: hypothetical protein UMR38_04860 [Candidatus Izemoplasma sp.]|nr:hypothetical protein [Candidatus Izemoplasma sp.]
MKRLIDEYIDADVFNDYTMSFSDEYYVERRYFEESDFNVLPDYLFNKDWVISVKVDWT